jgi:hypothetical protein
MECQYRPEDNSTLSRSSAALFLWMLEQYRLAEADSTYHKLYAGMLYMNCLEAFQGVKATKHTAASDGTVSTTAKYKELKRLDGKLPPTGRTRNVNQLIWVCVEYLTRQQDIRNKEGKH